MFSHTKAMRLSSLGGGKGEYGHWEPWWDWHVPGKGSQCDSGSQARGCAGGAARSGRVSSVGLAGWGEEWGFPLPSAEPPGADVTHWAWDPLNQLPGALDLRPHQQVCTTTPWYKEVLAKGNKGEIAPGEAGSSAVGGQEAGGSRSGTCCVLLLAGGVLAGSGAPSQECGALSGPGGAPPLPPQGRERECQPLLTCRMVKQ